MAFANLPTRHLVASIALLAATSLCLAQVVRVGSKQRPPTRDGTIRLASYNIENLFDDRDDPSLNDRNDDCYAYDKTVRAKPAEQRRAVADSIRRTNPDIIGLQEIESYDALIEFREEFLADLGYDHVVSIDVGQERGIEQAVLSKFPIREARVWPNMPLGGVHPEKYGDKRNWHAGEPITYRRSPLYVRIEVPTDIAVGGEPYELELFVIHHKSGRYNDYWREKEADALITMIHNMQTDNPARNIAILGDFNATADEKAVQMYRDAGLTQVAPRPDVDAASALTHSSGRTIDFIFVNDALAAELVPNSGWVVGTPVLSADKDWREHPPPAGYASDHMQILVDITPRD